MAGMHALGRLINIVGTASGVAIALEATSAIAFYGTNDGTYTLTLSTSFGGSYAQPSAWNPVTKVWTNADNGVGTGTWITANQAASNVVTTATDIAVYFTLFGSQVPATYTYVKCTKTATNDGNPSLLAFVHDLTVQRSPVNLTALSA